MLSKFHLKSQARKWFLVFAAKNFWLSHNQTILAILVPDGAWLFFSSFTLQFLIQQLVSEQKSDEAQKKRLTNGFIQNKKK